MNRTIWIWRFLALIILLACAILLMNLYVDLASLSDEGRSAPPPAESPAPEGRAR